MYNICHFERKMKILEDIHHLKDYTIVIICNKHQSNICQTKTKIDKKGT